MKIAMPKYVNEMLEVFEKIAPDQSGTKPSAAPRDLFVVNENCDKLDKLKSEQFHTLVAKMLFATKHARPDSGTSVSYTTPTLPTNKPQKTPLLAG